MIGIKKRVKKEVKQKMMIAKLIATAITYGIVIVCGIIGIWGGLG